MIEKIRLKDFLSHEDTEIALEDGINVFVGSNGAGKSSVIDAITYALYGKHTRDRDKNLVRRGASGSAVSLTFTYGEYKYAVERIIGPGGRLERAVLRQLAPVERPLIAGERKQYGESMNQRVAALLRLDYDKMKVAAIIQQGELDSIIQYRPSQFKELMDSLIGIDRLGSAYEAMREPMEEFRKRLRAECLGKYDDQNYGQLLEDLKHAASEMEKSKSGLGIAESELRSASEKHEQLSRRLSDLEPLRVKREELETQKVQLNSYIDKLLDDLRKRRAELERDIPTAEKMLERAVMVDDAQEELERIRQEETAVTEELSSLESKMASVRKSEREASRIEEEVKGKREDLDKIRGKVKDLQDKLKELDSVPAPETPENLEGKIGSLESERDALRDKKSRIEEKVRNYTEIRENGVCPTCDSDAKTVNVEVKLAAAAQELDSVKSGLDAVEKSLSEHRELLSRINDYRVKSSRREAVSSMIESYTATMGQLEAEISSREKDMGELKTEAAQLASLSSEIGSKKARQEKLRAAEKAARERYTECRQAASWLQAKGISSKDDIDSMKAELDEKKELIRRAGDRSDIRNLAIDKISEGLVKRVLELEDETRQYNEAEYSRLKREVKNSEAEVARIAGTAEAIRIKIADLQAEKGRLDAVKETVENAKKYIMAYDKIRNEIFNRDGSLATSLRSWAIRELSFYASDYVRSFGIGISEIRLGEKRRDVSIECYSPNGMMDIKSLSGGEGVAIALAIRFAMARLMGMGMIDFIILDEPTVYLDEERKRSLVNIISGFNAGNGALKQMVIITHDREIFENSIVDAMFQFEKRNGITRVQKT